MSISRPDIIQTSIGWFLPCEPDQVGFEFELPAELEVGEPPEARGLSRDEVCLMVQHLGDGTIEHARFRDLEKYLAPGDLQVVNTSGTLNAALPARRADGRKLELHLSTQLPGQLWVVELRLPGEAGTVPFFDGRAGETLQLPGGGNVSLVTAYQPDLRTLALGETQPVRLWVGALNLPQALEPYLQQHGFPIRYKYVREARPAAYYQTVIASEMGSAEMPSAGRAFTAEMVTRLAARGVTFEPVLLHTGIASLEADDPPYEEYFRVQVKTAEAVNAARSEGRRVIAVGTTVVRALESAVQADGRVHPAEGWTGLMIGPDHRLVSVNGLLTGFHEPRASHLHMLAALTGCESMAQAYQEALEQGYLWHEFGDLHLILPGDTLESMPVPIGDRDLI